MIINFSDKAIDEVWVFARKNAPTQMQFSHYNSSNQDRPKQKVLNDCFQGKLGELAWDQYCVKFHNMGSKISYKIRNKGDDDVCDFKYQGKCGLEIKTSKFRPHWLLVPVHKVHKAEIFILAEVGWDHEQQSYKGWVDLIGFITQKDLMECRTISRGEILPKTNTRLGQNNFAAAISELNMDFEGLVNFLTTEEDKDV